MSSDAGNWYQQLKPGMSHLLLQQAGYKDSFGFYESQGSLCQEQLAHGKTNMVAFSTTSFVFGVGNLSILKYLVLQVHSLGSLLDDSEPGCFCFWSAGFLGTVCYG